MPEPESVREVFERRVRLLGVRPKVGQGTAVTRVRLGERLQCESEDGPWRLVADMSEKAGGTGAGPDPGVYGRTALGSCMAIAYAFWAAWRNIAIRSLEVEVHADYDVRGSFDFDVAPEYGQVRCVVTIETDAPREAVLRMMDEADAHSPYLGVFRRPLDVRREVRFVPD